MNKQLEAWQQNIMFIAVLYAMKEQDKKIPLVLEGDDVFLSPILDDMNVRGLLDIDQRNGMWVVTKDGDDLRGRMVAMYDQLLKFEIFSNVNQTLALNEDQSPDGIAVFDDILDPRFVKTPQSEDLRLAVLDWYGQAAQEQLNGKAVDPHQIIFMQKLRSGSYKGRDFWFNLRLGTVFKEIDEIVTSAIKWRDLGSNDDESGDVMNALYTAGTSEQIKRDGERCTCGAYLGMYAYYAARDGKTLDECPSCNGSFNPPQSSGEECPNCRYEILPRQRKCHGCGAKIDRFMASGTVTDVTTTVTEEYDVYNSYYPWSGSYLDYGYVPPAYVYPGIWYDPYNPIASAAAFGLVCALL